MRSETHIYRDSKGNEYYLLETYWDINDGKEVALPFSFVVPADNPIGSGSSSLSFQAFKVIKEDQQENSLLIDKKELLHAKRFQERLSLDTKKIYDQFESSMGSSQGALESAAAIPFSDIKSPGSSLITLQHCGVLKTNETESGLTDSIDDLTATINEAFDEDLQRRMLTEAQHTAKIFRCTYLARCGNQYYLLSDFVEGEPLDKFIQTHNPTIEERINIVLQILLQFQALGRDCLQLDPNATNFLARYDDSVHSKNIKVQAIDLGLVAELGKEYDPEQLYKTEPKGTLEYLPPELAAGKVCHNTLIYMLAGLILKDILGVKNILDFKHPIRGNDQQFLIRMANQPYNLESLESEIALPIISLGNGDYIIISSYLRTVLTDCANQNYKLRPSLAELVRFFTALNNLLTLNTKDATEKPNALKNKYLTEIILQAKKIKIPKLENFDEDEYQTQFATLIFLEQSDGINEEQVRRIFSLPRSYNLILQKILSAAIEKPLKVALIYDCLQIANYSQTNNAEDNQNINSAFIHLARFILQDNKDLDPNLIQVNLNLRNAEMIIALYANDKLTKDTLSAFDRTRFKTKTIEVAEKQVIKHEGRKLSATYRVNPDCSSSWRKSRQLSGEQNFNIIAYTIAVIYFSDNLTDEIFARIINLANNLPPKKFVILWNLLERDFFAATKSLNIEIIESLNVLDATDDELVRIFLKDPNLFSKVLLPLIKNNCVNADTFNALKILDQLGFLDGELFANKNQFELNNLIANIINLANEDLLKYLDKNNFAILTKFDMNNRPYIKFIFHSCLKILVKKKILTPELSAAIVTKPNFSVAALILNEKVGLDKYCATALISDINFANKIIQNKNNLAQIQLQYLETITDTDVLNATITAWIANNKIDTNAILAVAKNPEHQKIQSLIITHYHKDAKCEAENLQQQIRRFEKIKFFGKLIIWLLNIKRQLEITQSVAFVLEKLLPDDKTPTEAVIKKDNFVLAKNPYSHFQDRDELRWFNRQTNVAKAVALVTGENSEETKETYTGRVEHF